jgi:ATP-dependent Clp protease ATP-binding subunit ClpA
LTTEISEAILFIDEVHILVGAAQPFIGDRPYPQTALSRGKQQVNCATTLMNIARISKVDAALERRFQPILWQNPPRRKQWITCAVCARLRRAPPPGISMNPHAA